MRFHIIPHHHQITSRRHPHNQRFGIRSREMRRLRFRPMNALIAGIRPIEVPRRRAKDAHQPAILQLHDRRLMRASARGRHRIFAFFPGAEVVVRVIDKRMQMTVIAIRRADDAILNRRMCRQHNSSRAEPQDSPMVVANPTRPRNPNHFAPRLAVVLRALHEHIALLVRIPTDKEKQHLAARQPQQIGMLDVVLPNVVLQDEAVRPRAAPIGRNPGRDATRHIIRSFARPSRGLATDQGRAVRIIFRPHQHQPVVAQRKNQLMIVPRRLRRPLAHDVLRTTGEAFLRSLTKSPRRQRPIHARAHQANRPPRRFCKNPAGYNFPPFRAQHFKPEVPTESPTNAPANTAL